MARRARAWCARCRPRPRFRPCATCRPPSPASTGAGWAAARQRLAPDAPIRRYDAVADALVAAYRSGEEPAMRTVWRYFGHMRAWDGMRRYVRLDLGKTETAASTADDEISLDEARFLVARAQQFESWQALEAYMAAVPPGRSVAARAIVLVSTRRIRSGEMAGHSREWDEAIDLVRSHPYEGVGASGQMTDAILERLTRVD